MREEGSRNHSLDHHAIEHEEDARERRFEGLEEDADLSEDRIVQDPLDEHAHGSQDEAIIGEEPQKLFADLPRRPPGGTSRPARMSGEELAAAAKDDIYDELERAKRAASGLPGYGEDHFHRPKSAAEKFRKNAPYSEHLADELSRPDPLIILSAQSQNSRADERETNFKAVQLVIMLIDHALLHLYRFKYLRL